MNITDWLDRVEHDAHHNQELKQALLSSRQQADPLLSFCRTCQAYGYPVYPMELIQAGEEFYASMRRSTNGGGENSPKLAWEDDFYELLMASLEQ